MKAMITAATKQEHEREGALLNAALQLTADERDAFLNHACGDNSALRQRLENLLQAHEEAGTFLGKPVAPSSAARPSLGSANLAGGSVMSEAPGDLIGRYKLLQKIGEGGCGVVYMAEQEEPVRRRVALKIIKAGMDTKSVIARFEAERQALALMDHPNIAKVHDAGATETGRPYFVMELVRGVKITDYCDEKQLSTRERLELFSQVCHAIQHAHQKGIIHRDIKPSNVLVTVNDGVAVPKVIDFGIAKATTDQRLTDKTVFTAFEQFIGTPAYMSPEQAEITSVDVDTRSDVYSLGVLLYELLTGKTPFDAVELLKIGLDEMRRTIREKEPARPSTKVSTLGGDELTTTAKRRGLDAPKLVNVLRGDLDWIVMKCLEKDRGRRYETANGLATDVQRHLKNEPVAACPPSNLYRFQKMVRRNKLAFAAAGGIASALVIGLAIALWQSIEKTRAYHRAVAAEHEARDNEKKARQIAQFFEDVLAGAGPEAARGRDATMLKEILDQTVERISTEMADQPETEAYLRERIAIVYRDLGDYPAAELMQRRAVALRRKLHPDGHRDLAKVLSDQSVTCMLLGRLPEAESLAREALEMGKKFPNLRPGDLPVWMNNLASILRRQTKYADAEALNRKALDLTRQALGNKNREVAATLNHLALSLAGQNKLDQAEATMREAIEMSKELYGEVHPFIAQSLSSLTTFLRRDDKFDEAEKVGRDAVAMQKKVNGPEHPNVAGAMANLAIVLENTGKLDEAESFQRQALAIRRKKLPSEHPVLAASLYQLGEVLNKQGKFAEAEEQLRQAKAMANKFPANDYVNPANVLDELNKALAAEGKTPEFNTSNDGTSATPNNNK